MKECIGNYFILNGTLKPVAEFDNSLVYKGDSVYEVVRMVGGIPVFFIDHITRLNASLQIQGFESLAGADELKKSILALVKSEKRKEVNIKIVFNYNEGINNYLIYYIESVYPSPEQYRKGVKGILFYAERSNPQSKVINYKLRSDIHLELLREGAYEAILVNNDNLITEGSKSNIFFLKDDTLITAPEEVILKGITRDHLLQICDSLDIPIDFRCVNADDLAEFDSVFMTGTSPVILPFNQINDIQFNSGFPLFEKLRAEYLVHVEKNMLLFSYL